jgi:hypothetical protein
MTQDRTEERPRKYMTDEELIARLRVYGNNTIRLTAADRIEELGAQLKMVLEREAETQVRHDKKLDALEAKLAKAIAALDESLYFLDPDEEDMAKEAGVYRIVTTHKELKEN